LELREISGRLVGEIGSADGLAPGERKRLTIAVELVSNAPIVFLGMLYQCQMLCVQCMQCALFVVCAVFSV
jgi:hypothetical protein